MADLTQNNPTGDTSELNEFLAGITETQLTIIDILQDVVKGLNTLADNVDRLNAAMKEMAAALSDEEDDSTITLEAKDDNGKSTDHPTL